MSALSTPSQSLRDATFDVYVKPFSGDGTPDIGGALDSASSGDNGWKLDRSLFFKRVRFAAWPGSGLAGLDVVGQDGVVQPIEFGVWQYGVDDQVRIIMQPQTAGTTLGPDLASEEDTGIVLFEGTLQRAGFGLKGATDTQDEFESCDLVAVDAPSIDNARPEHLVRGRFYDETPGSSATPVLLDGPSVPCIFNAGDRPNMLPGSSVSVAGGDLTITGNLFTDDNRPTATYWTLKEALRHLITCWLYGIDDAAGGDAQGELDRCSTIEPETYDALFAAPADGNDARWAGLDKILPETDVQGLGVYNAIHAVCMAGGYRMAVLPPLGRPLPEGAAVDRQFLLRVWRAGAGPLNELRLQARELVTGGQSAEELLANNTFSQLRGVRDTANVRNTISVVGRTLVETTVELRPLWSPNDMADPEGDELSTRERGVPIDQAGDPFHNRHHAKGTEFNAYRHVGRRWGIDCDGSFEANSLGYSTGDYAHDAGGFDWLAQLEIDGGEDDDFTAARVANGVTTAPHMSKRVRRPYKLTRPEAYLLGKPFVLEVTEDGGDNWYELPSGIASVLTDGYFGIMLKADDLLGVCRKSFGAESTNYDPTPQESWAGLLWAANDEGGEQLLRFRLTCLIELDSAARYDAAIDPGAQTRTPLAALVETGITEVWQSPSSILGEGDWQRLDDRVIVASAAGVDRTNNLKDLAERIRDERGQMRFGMTVSHWLIDPSQFAVGDVIQGIAGRLLDFDQFSLATGETRYPSIVSVTIEPQLITLDIGDEKARRGV